MKKFALMVDGRVAEIFDEFLTVGEGDEAVNVPLSERLHPDTLAILVPYDPDNPPAEPVIEPAPAVPAPLSNEQIQRALERLATDAGLDLADLISP